MKSLCILIAVLFLQASLSEASTACDGVYSNCIQTIDVFSVCWAGYQACITNCGRNGPLCQQYGDMRAVAQWVCNRGARFYCRENDYDAFADVIEWCKGSDSDRFGVTTYPAPC